MYCAVPMQQDAANGTAHSVDYPLTASSALRTTRLTPFRLHYA